MIRTTKTLLAATLFSIVVSTLAVAPARAEDGYKIAVVDMQEVLASYDKRKEKYEELQNTVDTLQKGIDELSAKIEAAKKDYDARRDSLSEEERFKLETKIQNDYTEYQAKLQQHQREIDRNEELVLREVLKDIQEKIVEIAEKENYHLVLNNGKGPRGAVLYASTSIDITPKLLLELNK